VFYIGTFSKTLLPDLRLGYIVAPPWALDALVAAKRAADAHTNSMQQSALALLISEGHLARHVRAMQRLYGRRREALLCGLQRSFGGLLEPLPSIAGLHVTARLSSRCDEQSVANAALEQDVLVRPLHPYFCGRADLRGLLLGLGAIDERSIPEGLERLRRALPR
jgi:GntR family transcriptional regulator/MocR family aminotransferase